MVISGSKGSDGMVSDIKNITLTREEFSEYKSSGYFQGIKYRWTRHGDTYTVFLSPSSYDMLIKNMESTGLPKIIPLHVKFIYSRKF